MNNTPCSIYQILYSYTRTKALLERSNIAYESITSISLSDETGNFLDFVKISYFTLNRELKILNLECIDYLALFQGERQQRAVGYQASLNSSNLNQYTVKSLTEPEKVARIVTLQPDRMLCDCQDFFNQCKEFQKHPYLWWIVLQGGKLITRKHIYATIQTLELNNVGGHVRK